MFSTAAAAAAGQSTVKLESKVYNVENQVQDCEREISKLKSVGEQANQSCDALRADLSESNSNNQQVGCLFVCFQLNRLKGLARP